MAALLKLPLFSPFIDGTSEGTHSARLWAGVTAKEFLRAGEDPGIIFFFLVSSYPISLCLVSSVVLSLFDNVSNGLEWPSVGVEL